MIRQEIYQSPSFHEDIDTFQLPTSKCKLTFNSPLPLVQLLQQWQDLQFGK